MKNLVEEAKKIITTKQDRAGYDYAELAVSVLNGEVNLTQATKVMGKKQLSQCVSKLWFALVRAVRERKIIVKIK